LMFNKRCPNQCWYQCYVQTSVMSKPVLVYQLRSSVGFNSSPQSLVNILVVSRVLMTASNSFRDNRRLDNLLQ